MRGAPHKGLAWRMRRIRSRMFAATLAFRKGAAIFWSNTRRKRFGANGGPYRVEPSAGIGANPTRIETAEPTKTGRSAGGVSDPARYFGKLLAGDEGQGSPPAGRHGSENWTLPERKGRQEESSSW